MGAMRVQSQGFYPIHVLVAMTNAEASNGEQVKTFVSDMGSTGSNLTAEEQTAAASKLSTVRHRLG